MGWQSLPTVRFGVIHECTYLGARHVGDARDGLAHAHEAVEEAVGDLPECRESGDEEGW